MILSAITPVVLTFNEEQNLKDTLLRLHWASRIVVVDSFSDDDTARIAQSIMNVDFFQNKFTSHAEQWNYALSLVTTDWALTLDADYKVPDEWIKEVLNLEPNDAVCFSVPLIFCIGGIPLTCSVLPPRPLLLKPDHCSYFDDGHTQRLAVAGTTVSMHSPILHDDQKPFVRWFNNQQKYAKLEAEKLRKTKFSSDNLTGKLRRIPFLMTILAPLYILIVNRGLFEFWQGWVYALMRSLAELLISVYLIKNYLKGSS